MFDNKIVIKVGLIESGNLKSEKIVELEWPDNWTPDFERFVKDLIAWNKSDMSCIITEKK